MLFPQDEISFIKYECVCTFVTKATVDLNRHRALQNCAARPGERFHNSTNGLIKWNHRHQNSQMARERVARATSPSTPPPFPPPSTLDPLVPAPPPYPIPIHPRNLLFVLTVNVVSALWNSLISQILPNNFRVTRHWIAFPRPVITKIPDASVSSSPSGGRSHFQCGSKNFPQVPPAYVQNIENILHKISRTFFSH